MNCTVFFVTDMIFVWPDSGLQLFNQLSANKTSIYPISWERFNTERCGTQRQSVLVGTFQLWSARMSVPFFNSFVISGLKQGDVMHYQYSFHQTAKTDPLLWREPTGHLSVRCTPDGSVFLVYHPSGQQCDFRQSSTTEHISKLTD